MESATPLPHSVTQSGLNWSQNYSSETMYLTEGGDSDAVSPNDIQQGQFGDCFFLASLGEVAMKNPDSIYSMITGGPNGTENVRLYEQSDGSRVTWDRNNGYKAAYFNVSNNFSADSVNNYNTDDIINGQKEIWPQVIEKAYGEYLGGDSQLYDGGIDVEAMEAITGNHATYQDINHLVKGELGHLSNDQHSITTFDTKDSNYLPSNLIGDHAYMFNGLVHENGLTYVSLINPWGTDQPDLVPVSQLKQDFDGITHGTV